MDHVNHDSEESSSGCESGWTLYLEQSISIHDHISCKNDVHDDDCVENEDEYDDDMSMVSDASSGPPHLQEHQEHDTEDECNNNIINSHVLFDSRKRRKIVKQTSFCDLHAFLDDTASSPFFTFSNNDVKMCNKENLMQDDSSLDYSQGHSTTYFEMV